MSDRDSYERMEALHSLDVQTASERDAERYYKDNLISEDEYKSYAGEDD